MIELYGIRNCDSCRSASRWLTAQGLEFRFTDLREAPPARRMLNKWIEDTGWQTLLNRRSKTWRDLPAAMRDGLDQKRACDLMKAHPLLIKRPVLVHDGQAHAGYSADRYEALFARD